jgi:hypothetical protein
MLEKSVALRAAMRVRSAATRDIKASSSALANPAAGFGNSCGVGFSGEAGGAAGAAG